VSKGQVSSAGAAEAAPEKDRNLRYQHAADMRADLQRLKRDSESGKSAAALPATAPTSFARKYGLAAAAVLSLTMAIAGILYWRASAKSGILQIDSIAVIPFSYAGGNTDADFLSDGLTESLIASLAHVPDLKVKSRNSVFRYKNQDVDIQKVGKDLTVDALLTGRLVQHGDTIQVSADLTNVRMTIPKSGGSATSAKPATSSPCKNRSPATSPASCGQNSVETKSSKSRSKARRTPRLINFT
jgi:TolB-like protein